MDPTEAELNAITTLGDIADWAGTTGGLHDTLVVSLGTPTKLRDIAFISRQTWDRVVGGLQLEVTPATDDAAAVTRPLNPTEESRVEIFRRVCLKRLGITPDAPGGTGLPTVMAVVPAGPGGPPPTATPVGASPTRKLKLSSVLDPTLDAEIQQMDPPELARLYQEYKDKFGAHPAPEVDPTGDQLSGLQQVLKAGGLPYVDLSIWGPFGLRSLRKQVFTSFMLNAATGEWSKKESPGPPNGKGDSARSDALCSCSKLQMQSGWIPIWTNVGVSFTKPKLGCDPNTWNASSVTCPPTQGTGSRRHHLGVRCSMQRRVSRNTGPRKSPHRPPCSWLVERVVQVDLVEGPTVSPQRENAHPGPQETHPRRRNTKVPTPQCMMTRSRPIPRIEKELRSARSSTWGNVETVDHSPVVLTREVISATNAWDHTVLKTVPVPRKPDPKPRAALAKVSRDHLSRHCPRKLTKAPRLPELNRNRLNLEALHQRKQR